jgi:HPt (histidine-containing phosphotransfer) domain-containing protein
VELYEKKLQIELLVKIAVAANESTCLEDALRFALTLSILSPKTDDKREGKIMEANEPLWNMSKTLEQLGGDEMLLQEVMEIFLDQAPKHLAALRLAVTQGVAETVETAAHTLKGELGYLGIPEISQRASQIEEMGRCNNVSGAATLLPQFEADVSGLFTAIRSAKALSWNRP